MNANIIAQCPIGDMKKKQGWYEIFPQGSMHHEDVLDHISYDTFKPQIQQEWGKTYTSKTHDAKFPIIFLIQRKNQVQGLSLLRANWD